MNRFFLNKYKILIFAFILAAVCMFAFGSIIKDTASCPTTDSNPIASSSIFEWFQKPAAIRFVGKYDRTYISWITNDGKIQMRYYDNRSKIFSEIYIIDDLYPDYGIEARDDHNAPSLLILPDGRILIFYAIHDIKEAFFMMTSKNIEDISAFGKRTNIKDPDSDIQYNYPQVKRLSNENIALFYRRGSYYNSDEYFKISKDNGLTWENPVKLTDFDDNGVYAFVYAMDNQIHIAWNRSVFNAPPRGIYYMYSPDGGATWKKRSGADVALPVSKDRADVVFNSGDEPVYVWDIVIDHKHNPFIVFAHKKDPDHEFRFAKWNGSSWITNIITKSSQLYKNRNFYSGGIVIDPKNVFNVFLSKKHDRLEIEGWSSSDDGRSWEMSESITQNSSVDNFRLQMVENYSDELRLVWSSGLYDGLVDDQWTGYDRVNIQSEVTKESIPKNTCEKKKFHLFGKSFEMFKEYLEKFGL